MKVSPHIPVLYNKTLRRYKKVLLRIRRNTGSAYQRHTLASQLKKLFRKLKELHLQLKLALATGTVVCLLHTTPAEAQNTTTLGPFVKQNRINNPLREPIFSPRAILTAVDLDKDGDMDIVSSQYNYSYGATLRYYQNQTAQGTPIFLEMEDDDNPLDGIRSETTQTAPAFADIDMDGDLDLFLGHNKQFVNNYPYVSRDRTIEYYRNDGGVFSKQTGIWDPVTKQGNPFDTLAFGYQVAPVFIDMDNDNDLDVVVGSYEYVSNYPYYYYKHLWYYENNGTGVYTQKPITLDNYPSYYGGALRPAFADVDGDGDLDLAIGDYYTGYLHYYKQVTPAGFELQSGVWDPVEKSGSPFEGFPIGMDASPVFLDFSGDGKPDLFVADTDGYYQSKYSDHIINYYENQDDGSFVEKNDFENPFDGVVVKEHAAPVMADIDSDGDLDAVIGNKYNNSYYNWTTRQWVNVWSYLMTWENENGQFRELAREDTPFDTLEVYGNFAPQFADVDGDGDDDLISGNYDGGVDFFRNEEGVYRQQGEVSPYYGITHPWDGAARLADIDNDQDYDLFITSNSIGFYYKNEDGVLVSQMDLPDNPMDSLSRHFDWRTAHLHFTDIDHDGDLDVFFNGVDTEYYNYYNYSRRALVYVENIGTPEVPLFHEAVNGIFADAEQYESKFEFVDYDGDGDLDTFIGNYDGTVSYFENQNIAVKTTATAAVLEYEDATEPVIIDPGLTVEDLDDDLMIRAVVTIEDFLPGEELGFTPAEGIAGSFDAGTGVLTFRGKASAADYQALLRTVTFQNGVQNQGGRKRDGEKSVLSKAVTFTVYDIDFTRPQVATKSLDILINEPPVFQAKTVDVTTGGTATLDLKTIITDPNGAADIDLSSLKVVQAAASGAAATIDASGILTLDYAGITFIGTETLTLEVCDLKGECAQGTITSVVTNTPPVITPEPVQTTSGSVKTINLMTITTDVDGNLDPDRFTIVRSPSSGAVATIEVVSSSVVNLHLDYTGITFKGTDELTISACDKVGACSERVVSVEVDVKSIVVVYNAIAPNSVGDNKFMRITGLPAQHDVQIFNRWGDLVYDTRSYQNSAGGNSFKGLSNNGKALPSGTYFYTITIPGEALITGYLSLKQ